MFCNNCGAEITDGASFCCNCGFRFAENKKFCTHCGAEIAQEAVICVYCGCSTDTHENAPVQKDYTLETIIKIFMIFGCISLGWMIIPLAWCIPLTMSVFQKLESGEKITTGTKICIMIFVNLIAGICLLCMDD